MRSALAVSMFVFLSCSCLSAANSSDDKTAASATTAKSGAGGEDWRYVRKDGLWWYWLPAEKWVYWVGDHWVDYDPDTFAQYNAARRSTQQSGIQSGNSQGTLQRDQGNWGPVRYNQYGQPQYPYSQRTSGIRQLGPVPAMGGVRSLPGWGGER